MTPSAVPNFLTGGGEMGMLIRQLDWRNTPIGPVESWSPALRMMVRFLLANRFPLLLWWGPEYVSIYNDPYRPVLGAKHPWALGKPVRECWSEIWHILQPLIDTPFRGGPATWNEDIALEINRNGFVEETHFTIAYSPVPDESVASGIGGVLATVHEISEKVVAERRVVVLRDLSARGGDPKTAEEACAMAARTLCEHPKDIPFALLYLGDADGTSMRLAGACGVPMGENVSPLVLSVGDVEPAGWPVRDAIRSDGLTIVDRLSERFRQVPPGPWSDPPSNAVIMPIPSSKPHEPAGLMIIGVSSRLQLDQYYRDFLGLIRTQVATAIANARAYEEEKRRAEALAEIDRVKTAFFSNVSHEFRTPLTLMLGPVEDSLTDSVEPLTPGHRERLELIRRNGLRLQKLVNALLDFSRIEAGRARASTVPTDLATLTADLASNFRSLMDRAGLRFTVDTPALAEPVLVDREMWEKIVLNLVSNAFKFTFTGEIAVALRSAPNDRVELIVRDTGVGIPADELPHVFERFHRVASTRSRTHEGAGIGLALVQELVKLHGGTVTVESREGTGTTFTVSMPLRRAPQAPERPHRDRQEQTAAVAERYVSEAAGWLPNALDDDLLPRPSAETGSTRPRILWADDSADMREYVRRLLSERYDVETVADGHTALGIVRAHHPDLVLSDVMMPGLDGFGLLRALRDDPSTADVPVILLSARAGEESRIEGSYAGADDYLVKPFTQRELLARVEGQLRLARLRRETSAALQHRAAQFETLLNQAPLGVYLVDADLRIRAMNPTALTAFGGVSGGALDRDVSEIMPLLLGRAHADEVVGLFRRTLETGKSYVAPEEPSRRASGVNRPYYEWRLDRIPLSEGRYGVVCYFRDITQQVRERKALEESREALREADRRKDEFLATLSHELRNPLAPLRNALHVIRITGQAHAELAPIHQMMERQVNHLMRLVDDLLEVSRISRGTLELRTERIDINQIATNALETAEPLIKARQHTVRVTLVPSPVWVQGDPVRLSQVIGNLLNNAAKYTEPGGEISLTVRREGLNVVVSVRDAGIGISPQALPRIFDLFHRGDRSGEGTGLGIGLTLARTLVLMHGGTITGHSDGPGKGSEFTVRLPLAATQESLTPDERRTLRRVGTAQRVLVVDDNRDAGDSLQAVLTLLGAEVLVARDGPQALEALRHYRPTVVLLDIGMPGMSGYEVARQIRANQSIEQPVIVALTGWGQPEDRRRSQEAGFDHHLIKPADLLALQRILNSVEVKSPT